MCCARYLEQRPEEVMPFLFFFTPFRAFFSLHNLVQEMIFAAKEYLTPLGFISQELLDLFIFPEIEIYSILNLINAFL